MKRTTEDTLSLLAGAGIGVLAMYLLDPDSGARRRRQLAAVTREAVDAAGETIAPVVDTVRQKASHLVDTVSETGSEYLSRGRGSIRHGLSDVSERASEGAGSIWHRGKRMIGLEREEPRFPVGTAVGGGIGLLALGAGIAWLLDPEQGQGRRHWLRDKTFSCLRDARDLFRKTGRHIANYGYGTYAETRNRLRGRNRNVTDEQLEGRVRSELGHVIADMSDIVVVAENGYVTLIGTLEPAEIPTAEACARGVRDVNAVSSQLQPRSGQPRSQQPSGGV